MTSGGDRTIADEITGLVSRIGRMAFDDLVGLVIGDGWTIYDDLIGLATIGVGTGTFIGTDYYQMQGTHRRHWQRRLS